MSATSNMAPGMMGQPTCPHISKRLLKYCSHLLLAYDRSMVTTSVRFWMGHGARLRHVLRLSRCRPMTMGSGLWEYCTSDSRG